MSKINLHKVFAIFVVGVLIINPSISVFAENGGHHNNPHEDHSNQGNPNNHENHHDEEGDEHEDHGHGNNASFITEERLQFSSVCFVGDKGIVEVRNTNNHDVSFDWQLYELDWHGPLVAPANGTLRFEVRYPGNLRFRFVIKFQGVDTEKHEYLSQGEIGCTGKLEVFKKVINDNGGNATSSDFTMTIEGVSATPNNFPGSRTGTFTYIGVGEYVVKESAHEGYTATYSEGCSGYMPIDGNKFCVITNDDIEEEEGGGGSGGGLSACSDGVDNDQDGKIDYPADPGCSSLEDTDETDSSSNGGGGSGGGSSGGDGGGAGGTGGSGGGTGGSGGGTGTPGPSFSVGAGPNFTPVGGGAPSGQVLGAATEEAGPSCGEYLTEYIRFGADNNPEEVKKLQRFLNDYGYAQNLPITGFYGPLTMAAVNAFQEKNEKEVLEPWMPYYDNKCYATGYVYKTTKRWINMTVCPSLNLPMPQLP